MNKHANQDKIVNDQQERAAELIVDKTCCLLDFLRLNISGKSRNNIKALLTHREVTVDGVVTTRHDYSLKIGQLVGISHSGTRGEMIKGFPKIIFEDLEFVVINKPAGLVCVATDSEKMNTAYRMINDYIKQKYSSERIFVVHRLDRDTSGVVLFAKSENMKNTLQNNWAELVKTRGYIAVVEGKLSEKSGRIHSWLKQTKTLMVYSSDKSGDGLEAATNYEVTDENIDYSMLKINLETGRKNQIRVHMKDLGHCIAGDKKYGAKTNPLNRLGLHAYKLEIVHPFTNKTMSFEAPVPGCFTKLFLNSKNKY